MLFYVYEHWRPDKDVCFWVGKGRGRRAYVFKRNSRYDRIVAKLARLGMCIEVRMVSEALSEAEAFRIERDRIAFWRGCSDELTNLTDGGEGPSGSKRSPESIARMAASKRGKKHSPETKAKMSAAHTGQRRSEQHRKNLSLAKTGKPQKKHTPEHNAKIALAGRGRKDSDAVREKKRLGALRKPPPSISVREQIRQTVKGLWLDPDYRARMVAAHVGYEPTADAKANMKAGQSRRGLTRPQSHREAISAGLKAAWKRRKAQLEGAS